MRVSAGERQPLKELPLYLRMLAGEPSPGQSFDVRWTTPSGDMNRRFVSAQRIHDAARQITHLAARTDVYVGVALRDGRTYGGKTAISGSHLLYIECDDQHAARSLAAFAHPPTMELASGTPEHLHLYWWLHARAANLQVESANRRLALTLGGDPASVDIARILRPPETFNYKHDPPQAVRLIAYREAARYTLAELTAGLPGAPAQGRRNHRPRHGRARTALDRLLLAIPPAEYVRVLAGRKPNQAGKIACPFHDDEHPSLQLYADGSFYCFGSGCGKGGTIYDFAAHLWGMTPRRDEFFELRERLLTCFGLNRDLTRTQVLPAATIADFSYDPQIERWQNHQTPSS
jgi:hypothetical protein